MSSMDGLSSHPTGRRGSGALLTLLVSLWLGLLPVSEAHVYWSSGPTIGRANLDGSGVDPSFISGTCGSLGVAADHDYVYWTNSQCHSIGRASADGSVANQEFITGLDIAVGFSAQPAGLTLDAEHLYWYIAGFGPGSGGASIGRANVDGTDVHEQWRTADFLYPEGQSVAVDSQHVYWTSTWTISSAALDFSTYNGQFIVHPQGFLPQQIAVDGQYIYWTAWNSSSIGRARLDGTDVRWDFIPNVVAGAAIAVGSGHIYWGSGSNIARADLDGTNVDPYFITGVVAGAIALDPPHVPDYMIFSCDPSGVASWGSTKCIADVIDQAEEGTRATGTVSFSASGGTLSAGTCTLNPYAYCGVDWYPPADGIAGDWYRIYAHYDGDAAFLPGDFPYPALVQIVAAGGTGPQMPVTKKQCSSFWQLYRTADGEQAFRNKGACMSYVAKQVKKIPAE